MADRATAGGDGAPRARPPPRRATPARWRLAQRDARRTLGPGKAQVKVNADLNVDKTSTEEQLTYAKKGVPLTQPQPTETLKGPRGRRAAARPAPAPTSRPTRHQRRGRRAGSGNYNNKKVDTNYGVDKTVTKTESAPGTVNKLNVALMVDKSVPPATYAALQKTVATRRRHRQTTRGDTLTATQVAFAKARSPKAGPIPTTLLGPLKWVGLGLAALLFLFFMTRGMRKRESETLGTPAWLTEIDEPVRWPQLEAGAGMPDSRPTRARRCSPRASRTPACSSSTS